MIRAVRPDVDFQSVNSQRWHDFERLFEGRGGPMYCWCMPFRTMTPPYRSADATAKKEAMFKRVAENTPIGIIAYINGEPVAWCSIAPLETHKPNIRGRGYVSDETNSKNVWVITCFFIRSGFRRQGMTAQLTKAGIEYARSNGAKIVEAYPVDYDSPSYTYMGRMGTFETLGFNQVGMVGSRRHMTRLQL